MHLVAGQQLAGSHVLTCHAVSGLDDSENKLWEGGGGSCLAAALCRLSEWKCGGVLWPPLVIFSRIVVGHDTGCEELLSGSEQLKKEGV